MTAQRNRTCRDNRNKFIVTQVKKIQTQKNLATSSVLFSPNDTLDLHPDKTMLKKSKLMFHIINGVKINAPLN